MALKRILNWVKLYYFSGNINMNYEISTNKNWEQISLNFEIEESRLKYNTVDIYVSDESILIEKVSNSGLRWPSEELKLTSEISRIGDLLYVTTNVDLGRYFNLFFPVWKGLVLFFTVLSLSLSLSTIGRGFEFGSFFILFGVLLLFNSICWFGTYYLITEANSLLKYTLKIIDN